MSATDELKPCPFCGGKLHIVDSGHDDGSVTVFCDGCGMDAGHYENRRWAEYVMGRRAEDSDFLPCPLCGEPPTIHPKTTSIGGWYARCRTCYMDMTSFVSRENLREKWNRRCT